MRRARGWAGLEGDGVGTWDGGAGRGDADATALGRVAVGPAEGRPDGSAVGYGLAAVDEDGAGVTVGAPGALDPGEVLGADPAHAATRATTTTLMDRSNRRDRMSPS